MLEFLAVVGIIGSLIAGIFAAKTGKKEKYQTFHCKYCSTEQPYRKFSRQICPACRRETGPRKSEERRLAFENSGNRFFFTFMAGLLLIMIVLAALA